MGYTITSCDVLPLHNLKLKKSRENVILNSLWPCVVLKLEWLLLLSRN